jgi:hypothetical protein
LYSFETQPRVFSNQRIKYYALLAYCKFKITALLDTSPLRNILHEQTGFYDLELPTVK